MSTQTDGVYSGASEDDTAFGLPANLAAAISYILPVIGLVVLLVEDDNEFLRFNAAQAIAFGSTLFAIRFTVGVVLSFLPGFIAALGGLLLTGFNLVVILSFLILAFKTYSQETIELPVFADIARSIEQEL